MKVNLSTLVLTTAMLPALLFAYPAVGGGRGLFRVQNALAEQNAGLTISLHALARNAEFGPNASGRVGDVIAPELSYAPVANTYVGLELFGSWGGQFQYPMSPTREELAWGLHDLKAGGKLSVQLLPMLKLGGSASYTFKGRESSDPLKRNPDWVVLDPEALPYDPSSRLAWSGLATLHLQDALVVGPNVMVNYGRLAGLTQYGAGVELQGDYFCIFAEAVSQQPSVALGSMFDARHGHVHVTPGITLGSATSAFVKAGYTFSFGGESLGPKRSDELIVGFGFATPFGRQAQREYGGIAGAVTDASTGAPLAATITFPDHPRLGTLTTDPGTGTFKAAKVPAGAVTVQATAEGYESRMVPLMVESRRLSTATLELAPKPAPVVVTGRVSDRKTGNALAASLMVPEADSAVFNTDPATGVYEARLMPGSYTMVVSSKDHVTQIASLTVEKGRLLARDFQLVQAGMSITLRGIHFDFDKATIKPESKPALDDAARILKENPAIEVEIQGHTDSVGSDEYNVSLSDRRAKAVVNYLVQDAGIDPGRLTAKGYGESRPVADNMTEEGRALNRRVDFLILGQGEEK